MINRLYSDSTATLRRLFGAICIKQVGDVAMAFSPVTDYRVQGKEFMGVYASQTKQTDCKSVPSGSVV